MNNFIFPLIKFMRDDLLYFKIIKFDKKGTNKKKNEFIVSYHYFPHHTVGVRIIPLILFLLLFIYFFFFFEIGKLLKEYGGYSIPFGLKCSYHFHMYWFPLDLIIININVYHSIFDDSKFFFWYILPFFVFGYLIFIKH